MGSVLGWPRACRLGEAVSQVIIPPQIEIQARTLVVEALELGGELWKHVSPATIELLVEAVALDLLEREERSDPPEDFSTRRPPAKPL